MKFSKILHTNPEPTNTLESGHRSDTLSAIHVAVSDREMVILM